jgi:hypothetical protein
MTQDAETIEAFARWLEESLSPDELQAMLATLKKQNGGKDLQSPPAPCNPLNRKELSL